MQEGNMFATLLNGIIENAYINNPVEECDYRGEDGLLYCGKCHTPRETEISIEGRSGKLKVPIQCQCRQKAYDEEQKRIADAKRLERTAVLKIKSNMDLKYRNVSFDGLTETKYNARQIKLCKRYVDKFTMLSEKNQGLLFYGNAGTGKTHFACCIANALMDRCISVRVESFVKILEKAGSFASKRDEESYIESMCKAKLLILDDLGAERCTDYGLEIVYNVIDSRYRTGKPMIVTTNFTLDEMKHPSNIRLERIFDRIFEVCYPVEFSGPSLRIKKAAVRYEEMKKLLEGSD